MTPEQLAALKADIEADPVLNGQPMNSDGAFAIADAYDALAVPEFRVWRTSVSVDDVYDAITWANFTPTGTPGNDAAWTNRALACQGKQFNLQTLLMARTRINPSKQRIRNGLQDALTDIPSGNNGNLRQGGWTQVLALLHRPATRGEKLFALGLGTELEPASMVIEGRFALADIQAARELA